jgi:ATP-dependent DNA ligase
LSERVRHPDHSNEHLSDDTTNSVEKRRCQIIWGIDRRHASSPTVDMLANSENLLGSPFRLRRKTLEGFFKNSVHRSSPLYLSASTEDLRKVEKWVGHIGQQLDGIIAKHADAPYRPGDDHSMVKVKNYRSADCVVGGFRDHSIGSARNELLLGLYDQKGHLQYVSSVGIDAKQKRQVGNLRLKKTTIFYGRQPEEKAHWSGEAAGPWKPVAPTKVVEVRFDHFSDGRFRHGCTFLRVREDKLPNDCLLDQVGRTRRDPEHKRLHRCWPLDYRHKPKMNPSPVRKAWLGHSQL